MRRVEPVGAVSGAIFAVFLVAGLLMQAIAVGGSEEEARAEVVARYSDGGNELWAEVGALLVGLAIAFALPFLGRLHALLRDVEGERAVFSNAALGGGILMAALLAVATSANVAAFSSYDFYDAYETDTSVVLLMQSVSFYALGFALVGGGVLVGSTSIVAWRTGILPRWLAVSGTALAAVLVFGEWALFFSFPLPLFLLWTASVSVLLALRERRERFAVAHTVTAP
jgi:hypothetical protein